MGWISSFRGYVSGYVSQAGDELKLSAERTTLTSFGIPEDWVKGFQAERASWGIGPPDATGLFGYVIFVPVLFGLFIYAIKSLVFGIIKFYGDGLSGKIQNRLQKLFFILTFSLFIAYIGYLIYINFIYEAPSGGARSAAEQAQAAAGSTSPFQNQTSALETKDVQFKLVNIQPLAVKQAGFLGPTEKNGSFNPDITIMNAIRLGARFFTLQIDYLDSINKDPKSFDSAGVATLLYRDSNGKLISTNGASINDVAQKLSMYAFSPDIRDQEYPVILYLHFVRTPDPIRKPNDYLKFMMKVAEDLLPIQEYILTGTSQANFRRQQSEVALLELDLTSIEKTVIVLSNADTTLFRNTKALGVNVGPMSDLDSFINMRVYLELESDSKFFGITQTNNEKTPYAIIVPYSRIKGLSQKERDTFAMKNKKRFVIAMPGQLDSPTPADMKDILDQTGINVIPLNLIGSDAKQITSLVSLWGAKPFYKVKPMMLQSFKVAVSAYTS